MFAALGNNRFVFRRFGRILSRDMIKVPTNLIVSVLVAVCLITVGINSCNQRKKITRLAALLNQLQRDGHRASMIYFDNEISPNRITVKLRAKENQTRNRARKNDRTNILKKRMSKI